MHVLFAVLIRQDRSVEAGSEGSVRQKRQRQIRIKISIRVYDVHLTAPRELF